MEDTTQKDAVLGAAVVAAVESLPDGEIIFRKGGVTAYLYGQPFRNTEIRALIKLVDPDAL